MARLCLKVKSRNAPKFANRHRNRCEICGRSRAYLRRFKVCRLCFRKLANRGQIPGVRKASW